MNNSGGQDDQAPAAADHTRVLSHALGYATSWRAIPSYLYARAGIRAVARTEFVLGSTQKAYKV